MAVAWGSFLFPVDRPEVKPGRKFLVAVRVPDPAIDAVAAVVTPAGAGGGGPAKVVAGQFDRKNRRNAIWWFSVEVDLAGSPEADYTVTLTAYSGGRVVGYPLTRQFTVTTVRKISAVAPAAGGVQRVFTITVSSHANGDYIGDQLDEFFAFGEFTNTPVSAVMNSTSSSSLDGADGFWTAIWPPLTSLASPNTYTLLVVDSLNQSATVTGLRCT